jgi:hypothetical protein
VCFFFHRLEQVIVQRRRNSEGLLFNVADGTYEGFSLKEHVENVGHRRFSLAHLRQMTWVAPHLLSLQWAPVQNGTPLQVSKMTNQVNSRHGWDIEVQQLNFKIHGPIIITSLKQWEVDLRIKSFRFCLVQLVLQCHNFFLKKALHCETNIPLVDLSQWHPKFDFSNSVLPIPLCDLPPRRKANQYVTTPCRNALEGSTYYEPNDSFCASPGISSSRINLNDLANITPIRKNSFSVLRGGLILIKMRFCTPFVY